jgi:hypothetical protein
MMSGEDDPEEQALLDTLGQCAMRLRGTFATCGEQRPAKPVALKLRTKDTGEIVTVELPAPMLTENGEDSEVLKTLLRCAEPSPFGMGSKTVFDEVGCVWRRRAGGQ